MATLVYKFGLLPPSSLDEQKLVLDQLWSAHLYKNDLIALERKKKEAMKALGRQLGLELCPSLQVEKDRLYEERQVAEKLFKTSKRLTKDNESKFFYAKDKELKKLTGQIRKVTKERFDEEMTPVNEAHIAAVKKVRESCKILSGFKCEIEEHVKKAADTANPRFKRWDGGGILAGHGQHLRNKPEQYFKIEAQNPDLNKLTGKRKSYRKFLYFRVASERRDKPIFVKFPMIMHRRFPEDSEIRNVKIQREKEGARYIWSALFELRIPDAVRKEYDGTDVTYDVGWKKNMVLPEGGKEGEEVRDGIIAATCLISGKKDEELIIPERVISRLEKAESIRSIRDKYLDGLRKKIKDFNWPEELKEEKSTVHNWKAPESFHRLFNKWNALAACPHFLTSWHHRDRHLYQYETGLRCKAIRRRNEIYKIFASKVAKVASRVFIEDIKLKELVEADKKAAPGQRFQAGHSILSKVVKSAMGRAGGMVLEVDPRDTSKTCASCGHVNARKQDTTLTCKFCGAVYNRDKNACKNIRARGLMTMKELEALANETAAEKEAKRLDKQRKKSEGRSKKAAARKMVDKIAN